jgi:hypothetical protein
VEQVLERNPGGDRVEDRLLALEQEVRALLEASRDLLDDRIRRGLDRGHGGAML